MTTMNASSLLKGLVEEKVKMDNLREHINDIKAEITSSQSILRNGKAITSEQLNKIGEWKSDIRGSETLYTELKEKFKEMEKNAIFLLTDFEDLFYYVDIENPLPSRYSISLKKGSTGFTTTDKFLIQPLNTSEK